MDLELRRKACFALGWTRFQSYGNGGGFWHRNGCEKQARNSSCECGGTWNLPAIETDNGIALQCSTEFAAKHKVNLEITIRPDGQACVQFVIPSQRAIGTGYGETFPSAACKALIEASETKE